ncbi:MAG: thioesterase family protein [Xanthomonadales bacterium]|nr:thioesterase family protein [Xanthomonadales bacterium]
MRTLHELAIELRWRDHDALDHVNNAAFLTFLEEARLAWLGTLPSALTEGGSGPVVARIEIDYRRQLRWPGRIRVALLLERLGTSSLTLAHRLWREDDPATVVAEGRAVLVWIDRASGRPVPLPAVLRELLGG